MALTALALAAVAAAVILATNPGSSHTASNTAAQRPAAGRSTHHSHPEAGGTSTQTGGGSSVSTGAPTQASSSPATTAAPSQAAPSQAGPAPTGGAGSPVSAVETFYHQAAAHQYSAAWALADPAFRNQLGGYSSFQSGQSGDRSITFTSASVTNQSANSATVYVRTTSVRYNGTQHCYGPVNLVRGSTGWLLDRIDINCR